MESIWREILTECRALRRAPLFAGVVLLTLFLAIGANSAVFSVVRAVLLRRLPFPEPDRLVWITEESKLMGLDAAFGSDYLQWKTDNEVFRSLAAFTPTEVNLRTNKLPSRIQGTRVSREFFAVLGVQPERGRAFTDEEDRPGGPAAVILSHTVWRDEFGGREDVLGATAVVNGEPVTVVGVMPGDFEFPGKTKVWRPLALDVDRETARDTVSLLRVIGRLRPGVDFDRARSDLGLIHKRIAEQFPEMYGEIRVRLTPLSSQLTSDAEAPLLMVWGAVFALLLIACANLTAVHLARAVARSKEMGLRAALGASRGRLIRQSLVQSALLSLVGGIAGLFATPLLIQSLLWITPPDFPRIGETRVDGVVALFVLGLCLLVSLVCGLVPAASASLANPTTLLREEGQGGRRSLGIRRGMVVAEIALSLTLLIGAGLLLRSLWLLAGVEPGFHPENVLTLSVHLSSADFPVQKDREAYLSRLLTSLAAIPGVETAGATNSLPLEGSPLTGPVEVDGRIPEPSKDPRIVGWYGVTPGFFPAMGVEVVSGRGFLPWDRDDAPAVAVVNRRFADLFLGSGDALGRRIRADHSDSWISVVGVIGDARNSGLDKEVEPEVYRPLAQLPRADSFSIALRCLQGPSWLANRVRAAAYEINPNQPLYDIRSMGEIVRSQAGPRRFITTLVTAFSLLALALAALGVYGLTAYSISRRTREIGIRISVGARREQVVGLFVRRGLILVLLGVAIGLAGSLALGRFLTALLYGVDGTDPASLASVSLFLVLVGVLASYLAARRVTQIDPWAILRSE